MMGGPARQGGYMGRPARGARPVEPWKDSLRLHMFIWGAVLLVAFLTPTALDPDLAFQWNIIIDGDGKAKIEPLLIAAAGLLSILLAFIPTSPPPRGLLAGFLGFTGIVLPTLLRLSEGDFNLARILLIVNLLGMITLVPGLLIREEYRESMLARVMVTIGALCVLAMYLVPIDGNIGIVGVFERIIDAPGKAKVDAILALLPLLYAAMSLLAWLPAPSSGLGKVIAWLWITYWPLTLLVKLIVAGDIGASIKASPYGALMAWAPVSAYFVLLGYGLATVIGKQLE